MAWIQSQKCFGNSLFYCHFSSFSGFLGHATVGNISAQLLTFTAVGAALGAIAGAWLMTEKLKREQVKLIIGIVLIGVAAMMIYKLLT